MSAKILVVDDNPQNIQVLSTCLANAGYDVEFTLNGFDAIEWVTQEDFDMVLLDIMMPEIDGFEVCQKLKSIPEKENIPVIFITAKTDIESITKGFELGGLDYIAKPFNDKELLSRVQTHISLKKAQDKISKMNSWLEQQVQERTYELNASNIELRKAKKELETLDHAKNEFLNLISHEIRTPLNGIVGLVDILKDMAHSNEVLMFFDLLDQSVDRLEQFVYKTLDVSILRTKGETLVKSDNDIVKLIKQSVQTLNNRIEEKGLKIDLINCSNPISINCNDEFVLKALDNILDNAIKFTNNNGQISIKIDECNESVIVTILDNGPGFGDEVLSNEISMFKSSVQSELSPGLGLYIGKLTTEAHLGSIEIGNNADGGAYISLSFAK